MELPPYVKRGAALLTALVAGMMLDRWVLRDSPLPLALSRVGVQPALAAYDARVAAFERSHHTARDASSASTTDGVVIGAPPELGATSDVQTLTTASACAEGCTSRGTCNEDTGRCECPVNWIGDTCQEYATPSCILEAEQVLVACPGCPDGRPAT